MKLNGSFLPVLGLFLWAVAIQSVSAQSWQQQVDSDIRVTLDDQAHRLHGDIQITYHNNSPETLDFVWMHLCVLPLPLDALLCEASMWMHLCVSVSPSFCET